MKDGILKRMVAVGLNVIVASVFMPIIFLASTVHYLVLCCKYKEFTISNTKEWYGALWEGFMMGARANDAYMKDGNREHIEELFQNISK